MVTVLLLAAADSTRNVCHYRALAHGPRFGSPWKWDPIEYRSGATPRDCDVVKTLTPSCTDRRR
ncbi:hypothetical protein [Kocuria arenosa]|uniref:hypothetical protein n=1 Tax=Kocuria arenosa TaxID=3071446 RepID=UPI0034D779AE